MVPINALTALLDAVQTNNNITLLGLDGVGIPPDSAITINAVRGRGREVFYLFIYFILSV